MQESYQIVDIKIDKLTRSIENSVTGDNFPTDVLLFDKSDFKSINTKSGWLFNWRNEYKLPDRDVYKLTIANNFSIVQGLISLTEKEDHVYIHLVECAPFNRGKNKIYLGVPGNLFAFACKLSFHRGFDGYVSFRSKSNLVKHYEETLNAVHIGNQLMIINNEAAFKLIKRYFKG